MSYITSKQLNNETALKLIQFLDELVSEKRVAKFEEVLQKRTNYITVVLEDIYQSRNASAVIRTCDCFGIQSTHIIENEYPYEVNPLVVRGANKWVNIKRYNTQKNNTVSCLNQLKQDGYRIIATSPHANKSLDDIDVEKGKIALVFGSEKPGISSLVSAEADELVKIPMVGFSESLNISVSAAVCLSQLTTKLYKSGIKYELSEEEKTVLKAEWMLKSVRSPDKVERLFWEATKL